MAVKQGRHEPPNLSEFPSDGLVWMGKTRLAAPHEVIYSTVTLFARLRGLSTSQPRATAV